MAVSAPHAVSGSPLPEQVAREVTGVERDALRLADDIAGKLPPVAADGWKRRLDEAATLLLLDQFEEAAYRYYVLVHDPAAMGRPELREAVFYLGESLHLGGSPRIAKPYYESLAKDGFDARYGREATVRLVEIASALGDDAAVEEAYATWIEAAPPGSPLEPSVAYAIAKAIWRKDPLRADAVFSRFHPDGIRGRQALYFRGAIALARGEVEKARGIFATLAALPADPGNPERRLVADRARLAVARIRYASGEYEGASEEYRKISETSPVRAEALFEQAWSELKAGRARHATDAIDLFLVAYPVHALTPKARLLRGRALLGLDQDDASRDAFQQAAAEYGPVRERIATIVRTPTDDATLHAQLGLADGERGLARAVPAPAVASAMDLAPMRRAVKLATEEKEQGLTIADARSLVRLVTEGLELAQLAGLPEANERRARAYELDRRAQTARLALLRRAADRPVLSSAAPEIPAKEPDVEAALARASAALDRLPAERDARMRAAGEERQRIGSVRERARDVRREAEVARARAVALAKYIRDTGAKSRDAAEQARAAAAAAGEIRDLEARAADVDRFFRELDAREARTRVVKLSPAEIAAAAEADAALDDLFERLEHRLQSDERAALSRIDLARQSIAASLESVAKQETERLAFARTVLTEETAALAAESVELDGLRPGVSAGAAANARAALRILEGSYDRILLGADLGLLDVAWTAKSRESKRIDALVEERRRTLDMVDRRYAPLLVEEP